MRQIDLMPLKPNTVYHLFSHAVENNNLFYDNGNYDFALQKWAHFAKGYFHTYAFCLMPNHFHLCVQTLPQPPNIQLASSSKLDASSATTGSVHSKQMNNFLSSYAQSLNKQRGRKGTLFRERFGRIPVYNIDHFKDLMCYIHHNPIHHFDYEDYSDWVFSSYPHYAFGNESTFLNTEIPLNRFKGKENMMTHHENFKQQKRFSLIEKEVEDFYLNY